MEKLNISQSIYRLRKANGLRQEDVANFLGVSSAAVSKWECAQSYPDIELLPKLAALFHVTIDELVAYEPQLSYEEIRKIYRSLGEDFLKLPYKEAVQKCRDIANEYYSCFELLTQVGLVLLNYSSLAPSPEALRESVELAQTYFVRVKVESSNPDLSSQALSLQALCLSMLGRPKEVVDLLGHPEISLPYDTLLASAYKALGDSDMALMTIQSGIYQDVVNLIDSMLSYAADATEKSFFELSMERVGKVIKVFEFEKLNPGPILSMYLLQAQKYAQWGEQEKALESLDKYARFVSTLKFPIKLHGDRYFSLMDKFANDELVLGSQMPVNPQMLKMNILKSVEANPSFTAYKGDPKFEKVLKKLRSYLGIKSSQ